MSVTPTGQPNKEGSDKNVGNPDTTLDDILENLFVITIGETNGTDVLNELDRAKAAIEAYTAKAVREELEQLQNKMNEGGYMFTETGEIEIYIHRRIEQLKQEGAK